VISFARHFFYYYKSSHKEIKSNQKADRDVFLFFSSTRFHKLTIVHKLQQQDARINYRLLSVTRRRRSRHFRRRLRQNRLRLHHLNPLHRCRHLRLPFHFLPYRHRGQGNIAMDSATYHP